ncbi:MAG TPA: TonB-dependent receptor [Bryobacteraceae bacterium]|nr:TonB-dependent receptor [Bryobacteraceae bacterium]
MCSGLLEAQSVPLEPVRASVTVVERIAAETAAAVRILEASELEDKPGVNLDDRLRDVPGFSLFRRTSSLAAHPTTQGVSLRGLGSSGASRTLVVRDGVPLNDPFGGWVYWTRIGPEEVERVEVSSGGTASAFGDRSMGGVIAVFSRPAQPKTLRFSYEAGNRDSHQLSAGFSHLARRWAVSSGARAFRTGGYYVVPEEVRGAVDRKAGVDFVAAGSGLDLFGARRQFSLRFDLLAEERRNGTVLQRNSTGLGTLAARYFTETRAGNVSAAAWHTREEFRSAFSSLSADRNTERLTFRQTVPAEAAGASALWSRTRSGWGLLAGADFVRTEGYSRDALVPAGLRIGGGVLTQHGAFGQLALDRGPAQVFLGVRHDFTGQGRRFLSPSAGFAAARGRWRARASVYRRFRAPTLNELFREFRVGNAVTQANAQLRPERLVGVEAGLDWAAETTRASLTLYRSSLAGLITNVTLSASPSLIVRQRQNAAAALARGVELRVRHRRGAWVGEADYLLADSRFGSGARLPQVARHQGSLQVSWQRGATLASAGVRSYSAQFEDERNQLLLPGFATVQLFVRRQLRPGLTASVAVENLLDRRYLAGFTPAPVVGAPRLWRAGLRWEGRLP